MRVRRGVKDPDCHAFQPKPEIATAHGTVRPISQRETRLARRVEVLRRRAAERDVYNKTLAIQQAQKHQTKS